MSLFKITLANAELLFTHRFFYRVIIVRDRHLYSFVKLKQISSVISFSLKVLLEYTLTLVVVFSKTVSHSKRSHVQQFYKKMFVTVRSRSDLHLIYDMKCDKILKFTGVGTGYLGLHKAFR